MTFDMQYWSMIRVGENCACVGGFTEKGDNTVKYFNEHFDLDFPYGMTEDEKKYRKAVREQKERNHGS